MSLNNIVAEVSEPGWGDYTQSEPPQDDGRPDPEPSPTTMDTGHTMPPYVHNQLVGDRTLLGLVWFVIFAVTLVKMVR